MLRLLPAQEGLDDAHAAAAAGTRMLWRFWLFGLVVDGLDGIVRDEWRCKQFADACDIPDAGLAREPAVITDTVEALRQDMPPPAEFKTFFGTDVEFGVGADEVVFPPPVASLPVVRRDNYLNNLLRQYADEALARRPRRHGHIRSTVEDTVPQLLPNGKPRVSEVARQLGMSTRTLSRKLSAEGVAFADILDQLRSALAQDYLSERELPISEIAWLLGYCEVSSFTHAFKRWTGKTPRQFRSEETPF